MRSFSFAVPVVTALFLHVAAYSQPVLITAAKTVGPTDTTITPTGGGGAVPLATAQITVQGSAVLTMNGRHSIESLSLEGTSALMHDANFSHDYSGNGTDIVFGLELTVTGNMTVLASARVDANGRGYPIAQGPGAGTSGNPTLTTGAGGGHGGRGADSTSGNPGGVAYGSITEPVTFGSGGGTHSGGGSGAAGGGRVRLNVGGAMNLAGTVRANGNNTGSSNGGSGAGGSVWITAGTFSGAGTIEANGGTTTTNGGGGRIALYAGTSTYTGAVTAYEGNDGGAGTGSIYMDLGGSKTLLFAGLTTANAEAVQVSGLNFPDVALVLRTGAEIALQGPNQFASLDMQSSARLSHVTGGGPLHLTIGGNATIGATAEINVVGRGYAPGQGPGAGQSGITGATTGAGAGHGGRGANSTSGRAGGDQYGSITMPSDMGSGGGTSDAGTSGAFGGGAVRLVVSGTLSVDGAIRANGNNTGSSNGGSGAGGSIWINAGALAGAGPIEANGGTTVSNAGGGRVALYAGSSTHTGVVSAYEGDDGGAGSGTIYTEIGASKTLLFDGLAGAGAETVQSPGLTFPDTALIVRDNAKVAFQGVNQFASLDMQTGARVTHVATGGPLSLAIGGNATIGSTAEIDVSGRGYAPAQGAGAGQSGITGATTGAGAGHGGRGADSTSGRPGGDHYGSITEPIEMGSGGGTNDAGTFGAAGGGAVRLIVGGSLALDGFIRANGNNTSSSAGGSGAGGSVWITSGTFSGAGTIEANGGHVVSNGGGGRIAVHASGSSFAGSMTAYEGNDGGAGTGTVYTDFGGSKTLLFDGLVVDGAETNQVSDLDYSDVDLIVRDNAKIALQGLNQFASLDLQTGGRISHPSGQPLHLMIDGDATIGAAGLIDVTGKGFGPAQGPGAGASGIPGATNGAGGGYGGRGQNGSAGRQGGMPYGLETQPSDMGSGGGTASGGTTAGSGGGAIRLDVAGTLTLDGTIRSNGTAGGGSSGAGSGGGVWVTAGTAQGAGIVEANGNGSGFDGGGGRVALYSCNFLMTPAQFRANAGASGAENGTVHLATATAVVNPSVACYGDTVTFTITTIGNAGGFQWRFEGQPLTDGALPSGAVVSGATTDTLVIVGAQSSEAGDYDAVVTGACGGATSNAVTLFVDCCPDVSQDGNVDQDDVMYLINVIGGGDNPTGIDPDFNRDGNVDQDDVTALIDVVAGGACP
ncbi:MAG: hypothetical protein WAZ94_06500 [Phycisphaerales bacterium]